MRIITLEEHVSFPELVAQIPEENRKGNGMDGSAMMKAMAPRMADITGERLKSMNDNGITMQVLSVTGAGAELLNEQHGPALAQQYNDAIAKRISHHPDRFAAFAHLPMTAPKAAADELERVVREYNFRGALINGTTQGDFLDHARFAPILARAEALGVPLYLHPAIPPKAVQEAYYSGLPKMGGMMLSIAGWGWHAETGLHVLRMIVAGTMDKYPKLKLIIGHMGEMLPVMMARCDSSLGVERAGINQRYVSQTLRDQVYITTSGIFTNPPLVAAIDTFGIDNILFSVDYPFSTNEQGHKFLMNAPLSPEQLQKVAHGNADRLLGLS